MLLTTLLDVLAQLKYHGSHLTQKKKQTNNAEINKELFITKLIKNFRPCQILVINVQIFQLLLVKLLECFVIILKKLRH